ncbi:MAG: DUF3943 domain-containing protein [Alphaproteobacteria bacterium]|nr:DUF3943 domain-containing protein [Alphaproteobacteria bacterium]
MRKLAIIVFLMLGLIASPVKASVYDRQYSFMENDVDTQLLKHNTIILVGSSVVVMGLLYLAPSSFTNWEDKDESPFSKWWKNVSHHPVIDKDDFFLNYVTHPYSGALYYMGARSAGVNGIYSFLYSAALSTFFWEYGVEAFAERPSIQDLIITPVCGAILGEGFYLAKRHIVSNDEKLLGSKILGKTTLFLIDPMTEVSNLIWDQNDKPMNNTFQLQGMPSYSHKGGFSYGISLQFNF